MTRRLLGILIALVLAIIGTGAVLLYVSAANNRVADGQRAVRVLLAKQRIPAGTTGESIRVGALVEEVVMPASSVPADTLSTISSDLDNLVVTSEVQPRQLLLRGLFGSSTRLSGGLAIPEGKLAISVQMSLSAQVGGYIRPGATVTVFDTFSPPGNNSRVPAADGLAKDLGRKHVTRVLLPKVEVIAVGAYGQDGVTDAEPLGRDGDGGQVLITVAVTQAEAEKLINAQQNGVLSMALLTDDSAVRAGPGIDNTQLFS